MGVAAQPLIGGLARIKQFQIIDGDFRPIDLGRLRCHREVCTEESQSEYPYGFLHDVLLETAVSRPKPILEDRYATGLIWIKRELTTPEFFRSPRCIARPSVPRRRPFPARSRWLGACRATLPSPNEAGVWAN